MRTRIFAAVFIVIVVFVAVIAYGRVTERARLLSDLQRAGIMTDPSASLPALRLQWFVAAHRIDPIFATDGTDPDQLRQSLSVLYQKQAAFTSYYSAAERSAMSALYPKDFLDALPDLQSRRMEFLAHPSTRSAGQYQDQLRSTINAYMTDAHELSVQLRASTSTKANFVFIGQTTTMSSFTGALSDLARSAREQLAKASRRSACLSYYSPGCESLQELLTARAGSITVPAISDAPDAHSLALDTLLGQINSRMWPAYSARTLPPLIAEHSPCYPYPTSYVRVWWQTLPEGGDARKASVANDIYLNNILPEQNPLYAEAYAKGARLKYQISGHYYLCVDAGVEIARTDAALRVYSLLKQKRIFGSATSTNTDLARQEDVIRSATYIDEHDIAQYIHDAAARIAARGYASLSQEIGAEELDRLEQMIGLYRQGAAQFDEVVRETAFESEYMSLFQKQDRAPVFALLFLRSDASVLFLAGNQTFSPQQPSFANGQDRHPLSFFHMSSYNALLQAGSTSAQVVGAILHTTQIERTLLP